MVRVYAEALLETAAFVCAAVRVRVQQNGAVGPQHTGPGHDVPFGPRGVLWRVYSPTLLSLVHPAEHGARCGMHIAGTVNGANWHLPCHRLQVPCIAYAVSQWPLGAWVHQAPPPTPPNRGGAIMCSTLVTFDPVRSSGAVVIGQFKYGSLD